MMQHHHYWLVEALHGQPVLHARCRDCRAVREFPVPVEAGAETWRQTDYTTAPDPELVAMRRERTRERWA